MTTEEIIFASDKEVLRTELLEAQGRIIELECAIKWWLNERMKTYSEDQYGKRQMRRILDIKK